MEASALAIEDTTTGNTATTEEWTADLVTKQLQRVNYGNV